MAYMELKKGAAAIVKKFHLELGSHTVDDDMEMTDYFILIPKGGRCILRMVKSYVVIDLVEVVVESIRCLIYCCVAILQL